LRASSSLKLGGPFPDEHEKLTGIFMELARMHVWRTVSRQRLDCLRSLGLCFLSCDINSGTFGCKSQRRIKVC